MEEVKFYWGDVSDYNRLPEGSVGFLGTIDGEDAFHPGYLYLGDQMVSTRYLRYLDLEGFTAGSGLLEVGEYSDSPMLVTRSIIGSVSETYDWSDSDDIPTAKVIADYLSKNLPTVTDRYHTGSSSWNGLTYRLVGQGGASNIDITIPTYTGGSDYTGYPSDTTHLTTPAQVAAYVSSAMPAPATDKYHTGSQSWSGLTYSLLGQGGASDIDITVPTYTGGSDYTGYPSDTTHLTTPAQVAAYVESRTPAFYVVADISQIGNVTGEVDVDDLRPSDIVVEEDSSIDTVYVVSGYSDVTNSEYKSLVHVEEDTVTVVKYVVSSNAWAYDSTTVVPISDRAKNIHVASDQPQTGMLPNTVYDLGTIAVSKTFLLNRDPSAVDSTIANVWYWAFETGSTAPTITWPTGIMWGGDGAPEVDPGKRYEISVMGNLAISTSADLPVVKASINIQSSGTITVGGQTFTEYTSYYSMRSQCVLTATAATGYTFVNWTENNVEVSTDTSYGFTVEGNRDIVANFVQNA